jgi:hypothetical protein
MKKIVLLLLVIILCTSCQNFDLSKSVNVYVYDFTKYADKGFLFTPEAYNKDYSSMGMIYVQIYPEVKSKYETSGFDQKTEEYIVGRVKASEAIEELYRSAKDMGADAVIRFLITPITKKNGPMTIEGIEASGFAIKRLAK